MVECVNCAKFKGCDLSRPNVNECADYKETLTNEEWLKQCNTEQLAEFIADELNDAIERVLESVWLNDGDTDRDEYYQRKSDVLEWLKEIHNDKQ